MYRGKTKHIIAMMMIADLVCLAVGTKVETIALLDAGMGIFSLIWIKATVGETSVEVNMDDEVSHSEN